MTARPLDASCPAFARDPFPTYAAAHLTGAVGRVTLANGRDTWLVTGIEAARTVLADRRFSAVRSPALDPATPRGVLEAHMLNTDAPEHSRLRRLAQTTFTGTRVAALDASYRGHRRRPARDAPHRESGRPGDDVRVPGTAAGDVRGPRRAHPRPRCAAPCHPGGRQPHRPRHGRDVGVAAHLLHVADRGQARPPDRRPVQ